MIWTTKLTWNNLSNFIKNFKLKYQNRIFKIKSN